MTSASACRPRLVGRPRDIIPVPTTSGVRAWGLLADLQGHEPRSTTAESTQQSLGLIDGHAAASLPSFRLANKNAWTITPRALRRGPTSFFTASHANTLDELHVVSQSIPFRFFLFSLFPSRDTTLGFLNVSIVR